MPNKFILFISLLCCAGLAIGETSPAKLTKPDSIYQINSDGTVLDLQTNLLWQRCSLGQSWDANTSTCIGTASTHTWQQALALTSNLAGFTDWRLPNIKELASLTDLARSNPAINSTIFPNTVSSIYWSGSAVAFDGSGAWTLHFYNGGDLNDDSKGNDYYVRLVRDQ